MSITTIGTISLNIAFILYLGIYLPQILHNRNQSNLKQLSLNTHYLLYLGYVLDLMYGFTLHLPWQYKTVSIVGLSLLLLQHLQIIQSSWLQKNSHALANHVLCLLVTFFIVLYFFIHKQMIFSETTTLGLGFVSRICFLLYLLPQVIKNRISKSCNALSLLFIYLNLGLSILDMIAAWCLNWGWPNKLASPFSVILMGLLLGQVKKYATPHHVEVRECRD
jgi:uncharacterized protein with PQ loop repeat